MIANKNAVIKESFVFSWYIKLKVLIALLKVVKDPTQTESVLKIGNTKKLASGKSMEEALARVKDSPQAKKLMVDRWAPKAYKVAELATLPKDSFGYAYWQYMNENKLDPHFYGKVEGDDEISFMRRRVRQTHDFFHVLTGFNTTPLGEAGVIAFTYAQYRGGFGLVILAMLMLHFGFFKPHQGAACIENIVKGWKLGNQSQFLFGVKFEELFKQSLDSLRKELNIIIYDKITKVETDSNSRGVGHEASLSH